MDCSSVIYVWGYLIFSHTKEDLKAPKQKKEQLSVNTISVSSNIFSYTVYKDCGLGSNTANILIAAFLHADMEDLKAFVKDSGSAEANDLANWDLNFWSERLRESKYDIDEVAKTYPLCIF